MAAVKREQEALSRRLELYQKMADGTIIGRERSELRREVNRQFTNDNQSISAYHVPTECPCDTGICDECQLSSEFKM